MAKPSHTDSNSNPRQDMDTKPKLDTDNNRLLKLDMANSKLRPVMASNLRQAMANSKLRPAMDNNLRPDMANSKL